MRSRPLTRKTRPGGRPRNKRAPHTPFADWLAASTKSPLEIATELKVSVSTVYNIRNCHFLPGIKLAARIENLTRDPVTGETAVPAASWANVRVQSRAA